ncbi:MAG: translation initiation factor IF-2 [Polyangiales bacterium]
MSKVRVYELAKELGLENKDLVDRLAAMGVQVRNHMSVLEQAEVDRVKRSFDKGPSTPVVEERIRPTVVRRKRPAAAPSEGGEEQAVESTVAHAAIETPRSVEAAPPPVEERVERPAPVEARPQAPAPAQPPRAEPMRRPPPIETSQVMRREEPPAPRAAESRSAVVPPRRRDDEGAGELERVAENPEAARPSQPPPASDRFAHAHLPPGVMRRGNTAAPIGVGHRLSDADRARIVAEHAASRPEAPRRREIRGRSSIGPAARPQVGRPGKKRIAPGGKRPMATNITVPSDKKRVIRIEDQIQLQALAQRMGVKATDVLMKLMQLGMSGVHINSTLDADTAGLLASEFNYEVENVARSEDEMVGDARGSFEDDEGDREDRAPIVTVMGHVDHGKTSLLDRIRKANVAAGEAGGITQHIGAYRVETERGPIVFLDTPGHEAFTAMRARGAQATDVVILVVAADDGVMPQTKEAISHAKAAGVPIVVAINKIDKPDAKPDRVIQELSSEGLQAESWGGEIQVIPCSAHSGEGIDRLLEAVLLQAEILQLSANPKVPAEGIVLEAYLDRGRGPVANVLIRNGTLRAGDFVVAGAAWGRVRAMTDERGKQLRQAGPATPVEILGLQEIPAAGDRLFKVTDQRKAQEVAESRRPAASAPIISAARGLDQLHQMLASGDVQELKLVVKADVQGSLEALQKSFAELSTDKVKVNVIHSGVGGITENDIMLAGASNAIVMGFNVRPQGKASAVAKSVGVEVRTYTIIYEAIDEVKAAMAGLLAPRLVEKELGEAEVRQVFSIPKVGAIAGCMVTEGKIVRNQKARLVRDGVVVWTGGFASLRRFKDDAKEVTHGFECGIGLAGYNDLKERDVIQCFEVEQVAATL